MQPLTGLHLLLPPREGGTGIDKKTPQTAPSSYASLGQQLAERLAGGGCVNKLGFNRFKVANRFIDVYRC